MKINSKITKITTPGTPNAPTSIDVNQFIGKLKPIKFNINSTMAPTKEFTKIFITFTDTLKTIFSMNSVITTDNTKYNISILLTPPFKDFLFANLLAFLRYLSEFHLFLKNAYIQKNLYMQIVDLGVVLLIYNDFYL